MRALLDQPPRDDAERLAQVRALVRLERYAEAAALVTRGAVPTAPHARLLLPFASPEVARLLARALLDAGEEGTWRYAPSPVPAEEGVVIGIDGQPQRMGALWEPLREPVEMARAATLTLCGVEVPLLWDARRARLLGCDVAERAQRVVAEVLPGEDAGAQAVAAARAFARGEIGAEALAEGRREAEARIRMLHRQRLYPRASFALSVAVNLAEPDPDLGQVCELALGIPKLPDYAPLVPIEEMQALLIAYFLGEAP